MTVWQPVADKFLYGIAKNNFNQDKPHRLELDVGDAVIITIESANWYYGYRKSNSSIKGIFPKSFVQLMETCQSKNELVIKRSEIVNEITCVLKEWGIIFKQFYLSTHENFQPIRQKMLELIRLRSQILSGNLPVDETKEIKLLATSQIDTGNKLLGLDMVVRDELGNIIDINKTSTTQLYEHHTKAESRISKASQAPYNKNRLSKTMNKYSHNLLLNVHAFVCKYQEDSDLLFTLYDCDENKAITENYVVKWSRQGLAKDLDQFDNHRVLFTDLSSHDLNRNKIYLICYAIRVGAMESKDFESRRSSVLQTGNKKSLNLSNSSKELASNENMRRPFGIAAIDLTPVIKKPDDFRNSLDLPFILCEKESLDNTLRKLVVNKDGGKIDSKIAVTVEVLHGDLKQIKEEYPHLVHTNVAFARKMGFPEVIFPGDVRNDLYLTLVCGEFARGSKTSERNIEVTVAVCNDKGTEVPCVIALGAGVEMMQEYKSVIYYHDDKPKWNETFKIQVPIEEFKLCHLRFTFKHRSSNEQKDKSEKPFGISYVKLLQDNGTTLQHKNHQLIVYKIDYKKYDKDTKYNYLQLPSQVIELGKSDKPSVSGFNYAPKDFLTIETNLCSTKLTQDVDLLGLLNWTSNTTALEGSLTAIIKVNPEEVVKFLPDILDALFNIMVQNDNPMKFNGLVFKCLLRLIEIVSDLKYQHFQSVLDLYINESFSATLAHDNLISVLQTQIKNALRNDVQRNDIIDDDTPEKILYKTMKHIQYIIKFVIRSRTLYANLNGDKDKNSFEMSLEELLESFTILMASQHDMLRSQGAILKYLHVIASDLMQVYDPIKLSKRIVNILMKISPGRLNQSKMICIKDLVNSKLFRLPECRAILLPVFCHFIKDKLESKEEGDMINDLWQQEKNLKKAAKILGESRSQLYTRETSTKTKISECVNILNNMLDLLFRDDIGPVENDVRDIMLILLRTVIQTSIALDQENPFVGNLIAIMLAIFRSMKAVHYNLFVDHFPNKIDLQDFLTEILIVFNNNVKNSKFPSDWMDMIMHQNIIILESLRHFSHIIMDKFLNPFEKQVWSNYFHCSITFIIQPALQLDKFSTNKHATILSRYADIRRETVIEIRNMWFNLGQNKVQFVPQLVNDILEMSLIPEQEIRRLTIPIFFDMMQCEYYSSKYMIENYGDTKRNNTHYKGNFNSFEKEMIEKLDILVEGGQGDEEYKNMFHDIMMESCKSHNILKHCGVAFVNMVTKLLERLLEYRCIMNDESKENRMACTVSLLQFYSEVNRKEMYIRYVNKLCDLHMEFDNFTEAAFTLRLHSNLLNWTDDHLSQLLRSDRHPPCQTHRQLKQALYYEIIDLFDKGKMWECAIEICKELAQQYEYETFDYIKLSEIHEMQSVLFRKIIKEMRHESEYFRVSFYGLKFSEFLRNKMFVYRGKEYERLSDFCARISSQHPAAESLQTLTVPGPEITQSDGQYFQINSVEPIFENEQMFKNREVDIQIIKYYRTNNVQKFQFSRPFREGDDKNDSNVGNLWLERTRMKTTLPLPQILRWFPVESFETYRISPIEYAIETMEAANTALRDLIKAHKADESLQINPLSMKINGIVDPAVMGGFSKYEDAFLTEDYQDAHPNEYNLIEKLKELIALQIPLLDIAIMVHKCKAPPQLAPLQERLEKCFAEMQAKIEAKYGKRISDLKFERDSYVVLRRNIMTPQMSFDSSNRLSETSVGSADSGSRFLPGVRTQASSNPIISTISHFARNSSNIKSKGKDKDKLGKRRSTRKPDRETLSLPLSNGTQWYTSPSLAPIDSPSSDNNNLSNSAPASAAVVELTEELTPKRPLRSEVEKERRLSRTASIATPTASIKSFIEGTNHNNNNTNDTHSLSGESSNRNSIITTDSTNSEDDQIPPPLPIKTRDSTDYSSLTPTDVVRVAFRSSKPLPAIPNQVPNYEYLDRKFGIPDVYDDKKRPPTPPPKPSRNSKHIPTTLTD